MSDSLQRGKERLLKQAFRILMFVGILAVIPSLVFSIIGRLPQVFVLDIAVFTLFVYFALSKQSNYLVLVTVFMVISFLIALVVLYYTGPYGAGYIWFSAGVIMSALYGKRNIVYFSLAGMVIAFSGYAAAALMGVTPISYPLPALIVTGLNLFVVTLIITFIVFHLLNMTQTAIDAEKGYAGQLEEELCVNQKMRENLSEALLQKSLMLQELNHRVKNNMQVISSLINLTSYKQDQKDYIQQLRNRIRSITAVHYLLFAEQDLRTINLVRLVESIVQYLETGHSQSQIELQFSAGEHEILIHPDRGVNLAIVLNELIMNSAKHAFPSTSAGAKIAVEADERNGFITLSVSDNGTGYNYQESADGLGLTLVKKLIEQAEAEFDCVSGDSGTRCMIRLLKEKALTNPQEITSPGTPPEKSGHQESPSSSSVKSM